MNLYFILNANQNVIRYVPFTHANMLLHWLLDFYAVTKGQNIVYLHMLGDMAFVILFTAPCSTGPLNSLDRSHLK